MIDESITPKERDVRWTGRCLQQYIQDQWCLMTDVILNDDGVLQHRCDEGWRDASISRETDDGVLQFFNNKIGEWQDLRMVLASGLIMPKRVINGKWQDVLVESDKDHNRFIQDVLAERDQTHNPGGHQ